MSTQYYFRINIEQGKNLNNLGDIILFSDYPLLNINMSKMDSDSKENIYTIYHIYCTHVFSIDLYYENIGNPKNDLLKFVETIMKDYFGDCILDVNGDIAIMIRKSRKITFSKSYLNIAGDYFSPEMFGLPYEIGEIEEFGDEDD